jgi:hypothetical protein
LRFIFYEVRVELVFTKLKQLAIVEIPCHGVRNYIPEEIFAPGFFGYQFWMIKSPKELVSFIRVLLILLASLLMVLLKFILLQRIDV